MNKQNLPDFESCKNMIYKLALSTWKKNRYQRPDVQFDDVYAEGQLIYVQCLQSYIGSKGTKFTTYLFQNLLGRLDDYYVCTMKPILHYEDFSINSKHDGNEDNSFESIIESCNYELDNNELLEVAKEELSYEGFQVFKFILSLEWVNAHAKVKPNTVSICRKFGYTPEIVDSIMGEIKQFWNKTGYAVA